MLKPFSKQNKKAHVPFHCALAAFWMNKCFTVSLAQIVKTLIELDFYDSHAMRQIHCWKGLLFPFVFYGDE